MEGINTQLDGMESTVKEVEGGISDLGHTTKSYGHESTSTLRDVNVNWLAAGAGILAAGMAIEGLMRSTQAIRYELGVAAAHFSITEDAMIGMINEEANATLSHQDATKALGRLIQMQVDEEDQAMHLVRVFDRLADATGIDIVQGIDVVNSTFRALGKDINDVEDYLDSFTWLSRHTTTDLNTMQRAIVQNADEFKIMGADVDDVIILFGAMQEAGIEGRYMTTKLNEAMRDYDGTLGGLHQALGLTNGEIENQTTRMAGAVGIAEEYADIYKNTKTLTEELQSKFQGYNIQLGKVASEHEWLSTTLIGVGTAITGAWAAMKVGGIVIGIGKGIVAVITAIIGVVGAVPVAIAAAVIAVGVAVWQIWKHWDTIKEGFLESIDWLKDVGGQLMQGLLDGIMGMKDSIVAGVVGIGQAIAGGLKGFFGMSSPSKLMMEYGVNVGQGFNMGINDSMPPQIQMPQIQMPQIQMPQIPQGVSGFTPAMAGAGSYSPSVSIVVNTQTGNASEIAEKIDRRLREVFNSHAEQYFGRQRRKRPRKREVAE